ncbi:hypothetical protein HY947_02310 [Candidatus Gottesmanbacteria bacterium]|nr:hypothetical protein [Candidatus Gottesmanbacteria bacterium]
MMRISIRFLSLVFVGIFFRIFLISYSLGYRENTDILRWKDWGRISYLFSLKDTYKPDYLSFGTLPNNMPPGTLYIVSGMYRLNILASKFVLRFSHEDPGSNMFLNATLPIIFLRIPSLFFDILIAVLMYIILKKESGEKVAATSSMLFFFNPIVLYNSSVWGQMDSVTTGLFLLAFVSFYKKHFTFALLFAMFSFFVKLSLVFLLPILILGIFISSKSLAATLKSIAVSLVLTMAAILPLSASPLSWVWNFLLKNATGEMQNITAFAFNLWWFFFTPVLSIVSNQNVFEFSGIRLMGSPLVTQTFLGVPLWIYAVTLFIISLLPFIHMWFSQKGKFLEPRKLFLFSALVSLLVFLILPQMHERYMYPVFPFLALAIGLGEPFLSEFFSLSVLHLMNLIFVWHPMKELLLFYPVMNSSLVQWGISAGIVSVSLFVYWKSYYRLNNPND